MQFFNSNNVGQQIKVMILENICQNASIRVYIDTLGNGDFR